MTCGTVYFRQRKSSRQRSWKSSPKQTRSSRAGAPSSSRPPVNSSRTKRCVTFLTAQQRREQAKVGILAHLVRFSYPEHTPEHKYGKIGQKIDLPILPPVMLGGPPPPGTPAAALFAAAQAQAQLRAQSQSQAQQSPVPAGSPIPTTPGKPTNGLTPPASGRAEGITSDGEASTPQASSKSVSQPY